MKKVYSFIGIFILLINVSLLFSQGTTTSTLMGKVMDDAGNSLPGATILLVETGSGTTYGTISDDKGFYRLANVNPGGPYKLTFPTLGLSLQ